LFGLVDDKLTILGLKGGSRGSIVTAAATRGAL
jgi:hypothetical protein